MRRGKPLFRDPEQLPGRGRGLQTFRRGILRLDPDAVPGDQLPEILRKPGRRHTGL